ncbi:MAG: putative transporter ATP-binding protein [Rhizobacter sp.]|nr:putative transporter ATP-binding protein [Rhizobacter sp.]
MIRLGGPAVSEGRAPRVLRLTGITRRFGSLVAVDSISLDLARGEVLALLGDNGAGKSTLAHVLLGHLQADAGRIEAFGKPLRSGDPGAAIAAGIGMVHRHPALVETFDVLDNVMLGTESMWLPFTRRGRARARLVETGERFGIAVDPDAMVASLSASQRQQVKILEALMRGARILVVDEPCAALRPQENDALFATLERLVEQGLSIIFIGRKPAEALRVAQRIAVMSGGRLVATLDARETTRASLAGLMAGQPAPPLDRGGVRLGSVACQLRDASVVADDGRKLLDRASLSVHAGEVVAVAGMSAQGYEQGWEQGHERGHEQGQQALAEVLCGLRPLTSGSVTVEGHAVAAEPADWTRAGVARMPERCGADASIGDLALWENAVLERYRSRTFARFGIVDREAARAHARRLIAGYDVRGTEANGVDTAACELSAGNLQKFNLGRVLVGDPKSAVLPRFIVAVQPTRDMDVASAAQVHRQLLNACEGGTGVLLISDDLDEVFALADRVAVMHEGRLTDALPLADWTLADMGLAMAGQTPTRSYVVDDSNTVPSMFARVIDTRSGDVEPIDSQVIDLGSPAREPPFAPGKASRSAPGPSEEHPGTGHAA